MSLDSPDPSERPTPSAVGREARRHALVACELRDWRGVYEWTKIWVSAGGGAWTVDAWLLYVISAVLNRQPRGAVRSIDIALGNWIEVAEDRAALHWARAAVVHRLLGDPKTARCDYEAALLAAAEWLRPRVEADLALCVADAASSRKRKASVEGAPEFAPPADRGFVARMPLRELPGAMPTVWPRLLDVLDLRPPGESAT